MSPIDRLRAWWYTGPVGHAVAGAADWAQLLARYVAARARARARARGPRDDGAGVAGRRPR